MFGAAAMSLSSFCVVTNALRLNLFKVHDASRDKKIKQNVEEIHYISANAEMKNVTGMMCGHCEAHVTKAVKEAFGVEGV